ncbi:MAG: tetratricopeptide repeat protein [Hyphomicrobium sp.]
MRTSKLFALISLASVVFATAALAGGVKFRSPDDALRQGISAFNGGYYELALPALEAAAETSPVVGAYYLARIYADNDGAYTDHPKAYAIFKRLADELRDVDPDDEAMAPIAAAALTAVSGYLRTGITEAGIKADVVAADRSLQRAALSFNNEDAQFELAKVLLRGEGPDINLSGDDDQSSKIENGRHWLSRLSRSGHPGAQAFLADLMWRGKFVPKDQITALNLIDVAVANAPPSERVWIDDIYQNIYCNAGEGVRRQATGRVAEWRDRFGRRPQAESNKQGLAELAADPVRTCANGEQVRPIGNGVQTFSPPTDDMREVQLPRPADQDVQGVGSGFAPEDVPQR